MPDDVSQQTTTEPTGSAGSSFGVEEFLTEAGAAPPLEDTSHVGDPDPEGGTPPASPAETLEQPAPHKRSISEIQAYRSQQARGRKFDGLAEDEVSVFKSMSQEAYDYLYPKYLASKEHETKIRELEEKYQTADSHRWYEEPNAYTLHPEYSSLSANLTNLDSEENFWKEQLAAVEDGKPWNTLQQKTNANGEVEYFYGPEQQPSSAGKAEILANLTKCTQYRTMVTDKLNNLRSTFVGRHKTFNERLQAADKNLFGTVDFSKNPALKKSYDNWLNQFPPEVHGQLPFQMLSKSAAIIEHLVQQLRAKDVSDVRKSSVAKVVKVAGPGNGVSTGNGGKTPEDYDRAFETMTQRKLS